MMRCEHNHASVLLIVPTNAIFRDDVRDALRRSL